MLCQVYNIGTGGKRFITKTLFGLNTCCKTKLKKCMTALFSFLNNLYALLVI